MIAIVDYNMGNLASVLNACKKIGIKADIVSDSDKLQQYDKIILPGVGAFGDAMSHLKSFQMDESIKEFAKSGKYIFGICLGMQLLFDSSDEFGSHDGLGLIDGQIVEFDKSKMDKDEQKVPHIGWNKIITKDDKLFQGISNPYLYFVHSFHIKTKQQNIIADTYYGYKFTSGVRKDNIYGLQPHPEKSHNDGLQILKNFIDL